MAYIRMKLIPTLKQLEYLSALAETQHFGKAAERCSVTVSTLSAGIQDLEDVLGVALAERTKRRVLITSLGNDIAIRARTLLLGAEDIMSLATTNRTPLTGDVRLGVIPTVGPFLLPRILHGLRTSYPALRLILDEKLTQPLLDRLRFGELDLALIALPFDTRELATQVLFEDEFVFACSEGHPFGRQRKVSMADLAREPLMLLEEGHCLRAHALQVCTQRGKNRRSPFEASSFHTLVQMVGSGIGVTLLPKLAVDMGIADGMDISLLPLAEPASRQIALVWRQASPRHDEFAMLARAIQDLVARPSATARRSR